MTAQEIQTRLAGVETRRHMSPVGYMSRYVKQVTSAAKGAYLE